MAKQLFSEGLLKMAGVPLEEEPRKILEPRRIKGREEKKKQVEWKRITEMIKQTEGHFGRLNLMWLEVTELPEGIISAKELDLRFSQIQKLPNSLREVGTLLASDSELTELPESLNITNQLVAFQCKDLKKIPSYENLKYLDLRYSGVEEIGDYPKLKQLLGFRIPFLEKAKQEAESQGINVEEYIEQKHKLPKDCEVQI